MNSSERPERKIKRTKEEGDRQSWLAGRLGLADHTLVGLACIAAAGYRKREAAEARPRERGSTLHERSAEERAIRKARSCCMVSAAMGQLHGAYKVYKQRHPFFVQRSSTVRLKTYDRVSHLVRRIYGYARCEKTDTGRDVYGMCTAFQFRVVFCPD